MGRLGNESHSFFFICNSWKEETWTIFYQIMLSLLVDPPLREQLCWVPIWSLSLKRSDHFQQAGCTSVSFAVIGATVCCRSVFIMQHILLANDLSSWSDPVLFSLSMKCGKEVFICLFKELESNKRPIDDVGLKIYNRKEWHITMYISGENPV